MSAVDVGGADEIAAGVEEFPDDALRFRLRARASGAGPEVHRAERRAGHGESGPGRPGVSHDAVPSYYPGRRPGSAGNIRGLAPVTRGGSDAWPEPARSGAA